MTAREEVTVLSEALLVQIKEALDLSTRQMDDLTDEEVVSRLVSGYVNSREMKREAHRVSAEQRARADRARDMVKRLREIDTLQNDGGWSGSPLHEAVWQATRPGTMISHISAMYVADRLAERHHVRICTCVEDEADCLLHGDLP